MSTIDTGLLTAQNFLDLAKDPPGVRSELAHGEIVVSPSASPDHSYADRTLGTLIANHVRARRLGQLFGDVDTVLGPLDVRRPDLLYFSNNRLHLIGEKAMHGPPDLCVEIISPSSERLDRNEKFGQYAAFGVENYWIIDTRRRTAEAYVLSGGVYELRHSGRDGETVAFPPFDGLFIPLGELWRSATPPRSDV